MSDCPMRLIDPVLSNGSGTVPVIQVSPMSPNRPTVSKPESYDLSMVGVYAFGACLMLIGLILIY